jgi:hypothetical protein
LSGGNPAAARRRCSASMVVRRLGRCGASGAAGGPAGASGAASRIGLGKLIVTVQPLYAESVNVYGIVLQSNVPVVSHPRIEPPSPPEKSIVKPHWQVHSVPSPLALAILAVIELPSPSAPYHEHKSKPCSAQNADSAYVHSVQVNVYVPKPGTTTVTTMVRLSA